MPGSKMLLPGESLTDIHQTGHANEFQAISLSGEEPGTYVCKLCIGLTETASRNAGESLKYIDVFQGVPLFSCSSVLFTVVPIATTEGSSHYYKRWMQDMKNYELSKMYAPVWTGLLELAVPELNVAFFSDTETYDGMKSVFIDYAYAMQQARGVTVEFLDVTCRVLAGAAVTKVTEALDAHNITYKFDCISCDTATVCTNGTIEPYERVSSRLYQHQTADTVDQTFIDQVRGLLPVIAQYDIVISGYSRPFDQQLLALSRLARDSIVRIRDLGPGLHQWPKATDPEPMERTEADLHTAPSYAIAEEAAQLSPAIPSVVLRPMIGRDFTQHTHSHAYTTPAQRFVIGYVGRVTISKGMGLFLLAAQHILQSVPHARFIVIGSAPRSQAYAEALEAHAKLLGLGDRIEWLGFVPRQQLADLYNQMDVFMFPSMTLQETFGIVAAEAMAMRVPVVCLAFAGTKDYCVDGVNAVVPETFSGAGLGEAALRLYHNDTLRTVITNNAYALAHKYVSPDFLGPRAVMLIREATVRKRIFNALQTRIVVQAANHSLDDVTSGEVRLQWSVEVMFALTVMTEQQRAEMAAAGLSSALQTFNISFSAINGLRQLPAPLPQISLQARVCSNIFTKDVGMLPRQATTEPSAVCLPLPSEWNWDNSVAVDFFADAPAVPSDLTVFAWVQIGTGRQPTYAISSIPITLTTL